MSKRRNNAAAVTPGESTSVAPGSEARPARSARHAHGGTLPLGATGPAVVVIVDADTARAHGYATCLGAVIGARCTAYTSPEAVSSADTGAADVFILDLDQPGAPELGARIASGDTGARVVYVAQSGTFETGALAMRSGGSDCLIRPVSPEALARSVNAGVERARKSRERERRVERLRRLCRKLNNARHEVTQRVDDLCGDLVDAYHGFAEQMEHVSLAGEFGSLIRQELDVESLLRTTLEFMLTRTGPTNAAVFLPTGPREYSLGAYVNYDIPRETADVLLDHLADELPHRFEHLEDIVHSDTDADLHAWMNQGPGWIAGSTALVFACRKEDECLGVAVLFRDPSRPFTAEVMSQMRLMRDLFTQQLARVINVHNRHKPQADWPGFGDEDSQDDFGLAA